MTHEELMNLAIKMARNCNPADADRVPKVGAVIVDDKGELLATGSRGPDDHAEKLALDATPDQARLQHLTVYTTLEPCTAKVRTRPLESCTELLVAAQVKKVVIGILDPNQEVCGKGVLELQKHKIEVELFPRDFAQEVRQLNDQFIRAQQTLGLKFLHPAPNVTIEIPKPGGGYKFQCECITSPGKDIFVLSNREGAWWPQPGHFHHNANDDTWDIQIYFGVPGLHTIHVIKASDLGQSLISHYHKIVREKNAWIGIEMSKLPKGLDSQGAITVQANFDKQ